ncbi:nucleoside triphosphate pyrophosphohydrolase [Psychrilyobacter atlanticus]|uniref:nucleoside triphosphate pyrophosphohydrolase n=1 Tax=Psychrilyobacter atlanticus TaxID=271091 RepID=UPI00041E31EC|nr:nucleoside triphosphate pyrophosphohydrolase [Psychrilyobacter atlanticus]
MKIYNKLVRDRIPEIIKENGKKSHCHTADDKEYLVALKAKINEEVEEFYETPCIEEMADILEVLRALGDYYGFSEDEIERARLEKNRKRGAFKNRIILEKVENS